MALLNSRSPWLPQARLFDCGLFWRMTFRAADGPGRPPTPLRNAASGCCEPAVTLRRHQGALWCKMFK